MQHLTNDDLLRLHYFMLLTRMFENKMGQLFQEGRIDENLHRSLGQEAVGVGVTYALKEKDVLLPSLRTRSAYFVKGVDLKSMMAAVYGKKTAPNAGKESSHHMGIPELGIVLTTGLIGSHLPLAAGSALAAKLQKSGQVSVCFFGDGASSRGDFHEALNFSSVFNLPVIFVCENNRYAWSTPLSVQTKVEDIVSRAQGYGMLGLKADGQNVLDVYEKTIEAIERARSGNGPTLLECKTYRFAGHSEMRDWDSGRPKDELELWRSRDPIALFEKILYERDILTAGQRVEIEGKIAAELDAAVKFAEQLDDLNETDLLQDIYSDAFERINV